MPGASAATSAMIDQLALPAGVFHASFALKHSSSLARRGLGCGTAGRQHTGPCQPAVESLERAGCLDNAIRFALVADSIWPAMSRNGRPARRLAAGVARGMSPRSGCRPGRFRTPASPTVGIVGAGDTVSPRRRARPPAAGRYLGIADRILPHRSRQVGTGRAFAAGGCARSPSRFSSPPAPPRSPRHRLLFAAMATGAPPARACDPAALSRSGRALVHRAPPLNAPRHRPPGAIGR